VSIVVDSLAAYMNFRNDGSVQRECATCVVCVCASHVMQLTYNCNKAVLLIVWKPHVRSSNCCKTQASN